MLKAIVFAVTLAVSQFVSALMLMRLMLSGRFLKKYTKTVMQVSKEIAEEEDD